MLLYQIWHNIYFKVVWSEIMLFTYDLYEGTVKFYLNMNVIDSLYPTCIMSMNECTIHGCSIKTIGTQLD